MSNLRRYALVVVHARKEEDYRADLRAGFRCDSIVACAAAAAD